VSNFDDRLERTLLSHSLLHFFDFVVTTVNSRSEKPDPAIFHAALTLAKVGRGPTDRNGHGVIVLCESGLDIILTRVYKSAIHLRSL